MKQRKGFTLIELLVVIAIIALLVSILLPSVNRARELAKRAVCKTRLKGLGTAFELFAQSEGGWMYNSGCTDTPVIPNTGNNLVLLVDKGYASGKNFVCPSTSDKNIEVRELDDDQVACEYKDNGEKAGYRGSYGFQAAQSNTDGDYSGSNIGDGSPGALAIMADKGPTVSGDDDLSDWSGDLTEDEKKARNSQNHSGEINNVLFKAGHVSEEKTAICGYEENDDDGPDSIFGYGGGTESGNEGGPSKAGGVFSEGNILKTGDSVLVTTSDEEEEEPVVND